MGCACPEKEAVSTTVGGVEGLASLLMVPRPSAVGWGQLWGHLGFILVKGRPKLCRHSHLAQVMRRYWEPGRFSGHFVAVT